MKPLRQTPKRIFARSLYTPAGNGPLPLGFFDSPPPNSSSRSSQRLSVETTPRASGESHWQQSQSNNSAHGSSNPGGTHPPYSLALPTSHTSLKNGTNFSTSSGSGHSVNSLSVGVLPPSGSHAVPVTSEEHSGQSSSSRLHKRPRLDPQYILDVGAYGIPKRRKPSRSSPSESRRPMHTLAADIETPLSVQVGEDAYFISERGDAMGVADGVGGWSRHITPEIAKQTPGTTPSALFAKRLMHYCAEEAAEALGALHLPLTSPTLPPPPPVKDIPPPAPFPSSWRSTNPYFNTQPIRPYHHPTPILDPTATSSPPYWHWNTTAEFTAPLCNEKSQVEEWSEELSDTLEDLSDGLDLLSIMSSGVDTATVLDKAFQKTLGAHTIPAPQLPTASMPPQTGTTSTIRSEARTSSSLPPPPQTLSPAETKMVPLMAGSSTALIAVLDHVLLPESDGVTVDVQMSSSHPTSASPLPDIEFPKSSDRGEPTAVIKIAHVGDCMGMLIRDDNVVWRSQEMWVHFNTPLQLSPLPGSPNPRQAAQVVQLRVQNGDVLILASDGLSDNLWDEEVLDEVRKVRATHQSSRPSPQSSSPATVDSDVLNMLRTRHGAQASGHNLASVLSEALCSRAKSVCDGRTKKAKTSVGEDVKIDTPFAERAKEYGKSFKGGKTDDISVIVAVISPANRKESSLSSSPWDTTTTNTPAHCPS